MACQNDNFRILSFLPSKARLALNFAGARNNYCVLFFPCKCFQNFFKLTCFDQDTFSVNSSIIYFQWLKYIQSKTIKDVLSCHFPWTTFSRLSCKALICSGKTELCMWINIDTEEQKSDMKSNVFSYSEHKEAESMTIWLCLLTSESQFK